MRIFYILLYFISFFFITEHQSEQVTDVEKVLNRYQQLLLQTSEIPSLSQVMTLVNSQKEDGSWLDVNYSDKSRSGWNPIQHLSRVNQMALFLAKHNEFKERQKLMNAVNTGLDFWIKGRFQSNNWWYNQIGVPRAMRDIVILLKDQLEDTRKEDAIEVIYQLKVKGLGANLMWSSELGIHHACLTGQNEKLDMLTQRIWNEIKVGGKEGIQEDWSFHQHNSRLQQFHYGESFLQVVTYTSWQLRDTPWSIPKAKRDIISNFILKGSQWMCRGIYTVPGTLDRKVSRKESLDDVDIQNLLELWKDVDKSQHQALDLFKKGLDTTQPTVLGFKHFPKSDFSVYHRPEASIFLKTISTRTLKTESINQENQKGVPYLHSGDQYILRNGKEYEGLQPVWDWSQLPGLTVAFENSEQQQHLFTGGVGNGESGAVTMDYERSNNNQILRVKKMWGFHENFAVCLMGGWQNKGIEKNFSTALEQSRLQGEVKVSTEARSSYRLENGIHHLKNVQWILHNNIGYIPFKSNSITIEMGPQTGSWHSINHQYKDEQLTEPVFKVIMHHQSKPKPTAYVIVLGADVELLETLTENPEWEIMSNTQHQQWLSFKDGMDMRVAYSQQGLTFGEEFKVSHPLVMLVNHENMWVADPTHTSLKAMVTLKDNTKTIQLPEGGKSLETKLP